MNSVLGVLKPGPDFDQAGMPPERKPAKTKHRFCFQLLSDAKQAGDEEFTKQFPANTRMKAASYQEQRVDKTISSVNQSRLGFKRLTK